MYSKFYRILLQQSIFVVSCLLLLLLSSSIRCSEDIFDFFDSGEELTLNAPCPPNINPADVLAFLIDDLDALCILQQDFYLRTNELNQRSLLDYGIFLPQKYCASPWDVGAHFFYNQTTRDNYTRTSTKLCSYLAIFEETFLQELQRRIMDIGLELPVDLRSAVPLFRNMTVQERRTGFMFHGMRRWQSYRFRFWIPFYYNEANFFLTPEELDDIQAFLGITDPGEDMNFARKHLIADKLGFGDLRLNVDFPLARTGGISTKFGVLATIPTACALKKGLYGSHFQKLCHGPILNFCNLFALAISQMPENIALLEQIGEQFAFAALNHFSANLIDNPLGNGGHVGLGLYIRSKTKLNTLIKRPWADHINIISRMTAEYLFPREEKRYFIELSDKARFAALGLDRDPKVIIDQAENDPSYARTVLGFLEGQFTDRIFPFALPVKVRPGLIFRWITKYMYETDRWGYFVGSDTWLTTREKLTHIKIPKGFPCPLNKKIAQKPFGYQVGVMGNLFWKLPQNKILSLNAEYNFSSTGIGFDYMLSINFERLF